MKRMKWHSLISFSLALLLYRFFDLSKHMPAWAHVNAFADDPYDGVASVAVQLVLFLGLLSVLRSFRPYASGKLPSEQMRLIAKGNMLGAMAICLTMLSDLVAMGRHVAVWESSREGRWLVAAIIGLLTLSTIHCRYSWSAVTDPRNAHRSRTWIVSSACALSMVIALAIYPEQLRLSLVGELVTALAGMALLLVPLGVVARTASMRCGSSTFDVLDDAVAVFEWIRARTPMLSRLYAILDPLWRARWSANFATWINPRRYRWRLCLFAGAAVGLALVTAELWSDDFTHPGRVLLVVAVFVGLELAAVATGRGLLGDSLCLFQPNKSFASKARSVAGIGTCENGQLILR